MIFARLRRPVLLLAGITAFGVLGYRVIEGWSWLDSVWMAVITVTTIGFGEVHPLSQAGRAFTLVYILGAVGAVAYAGAQLTGYVVDGRLQRDLLARRRARLMRESKDHFIVVGYGRLGREVTEDLRHEGVGVVVIDQSLDVGERVPDGVLFLHGDGSSDAVLKEGGIERARGIAVATPSSAVNVYITLSARQLSPNVYIITRVEDVDAEPKARRAGANAIVSPFTSAGNRMAHRLLHPHAAEFVEQLLNRSFRELVVDDVAIPRELGRLSALNLRERLGVALIAIRGMDGALQTLPAGDAKLAPGDIAVVVGSEDGIRRFRAEVA